MFSRIIRRMLLWLLVLVSGVAALEFPEEKGTIPVAGWDVVPQQIIDRPFNVGVVAFHEESVRVDFFVKANGMVIREETVSRPAFNPRTGVWEYFISVDPAKLSDGPFEVEATCIPGGEGNREIALPKLPLYANANASLVFKKVYADAMKGNDANPGTAENPLRTLKAAVKAAGDGGTVILMPGDYSPDKIRGGKKRRYWTTIRKAGKARRDQVRIGRGRPSTDKLRFKEISVVADVAAGKYNPILVGEMGSTKVWLDHCDIFNRQGRWKGRVVGFGNRYTAFITGGEAREMQRAPGAKLMRNYKMRNIAEDVFTDTKIAINCSVDGVDPGDTGGHPDFHQSHVGAKRKTFNSGIILYNCSGVNCKAQGLFGNHLKDSAFVNCLFVKPPGVVYLSQYSQKIDHVLFFHLTFPNQRFNWRGNLQTRNCFMTNCILAGMGISRKEGADLSGFHFSHNHFVGRNTAGKTESETKGPVSFVNAEENDFQPKPDSPVYRSGIVLPTVPADIRGKKRSETPNRGAFAE